MMIKKGDVIYRQDAIDALGEEPPVWYDGIDEISEQEQWRRDRAAIEAVPSAQPDIARDIATIIENEKDMKVILSGAERKKGKWIWDGIVWKCSECGGNPTKGMGYVQGRVELYAFCPNCGSDMRGEQDE